MIYFLQYYLIVMTFTGFYISICPEVIVDSFLENQPDGNKFTFTIFVIFNILISPFTTIPFQIIRNLYEQENES